MRNTTFALLQSILAFIALIVTTAFYSTALASLHKVDLPPNSESEMSDNIKRSKKILLITIATQIAFALVIAGVSMVIVYNNEKLDKHMTPLIYIALVLSGLLLLASGVVGTIIAVNLQCYKFEKNIENAWTFSTYGAITGVVGSFLMLIMQGFTRRQSIKETALRYLSKGVEPQPPRYNVFTGKRASLPSALNEQLVSEGWRSGAMPSYHPRAHSRRMSHLEL